MEELRSPPDSAVQHAGTGVDLEAAAKAIEAFLSALGHTPASNVQLAETGHLVAAAFHDELLAGYRTSPAEVLRDTVASSGGDMIVMRDIAVTCICPHHLLPASGVVHLAYLPTKKVVGLGALAQLAQCLSRRLILQETLCEQIAEALETELEASGSGCIAVLSPTCLTARGERQATARVLTAATRGRLRSDSQLRSEFFACTREAEVKS